MKKLIAFVAILMLVTILPAHSKPATIFEDAPGDAGMDAAGPIPLMTEAGFDITKGTIEKVGKELVWTVEHATMPATNQPGEAFRFLWHFDYKGKQYRFTVKSFDIGKPDVIAQTGTERIGQVYPNGVARLEEGYIDATLPLQLSQFQVLEYFEVTFDAAKKTVSWKMPLAALKLKPGSTIEPGTGGSTGTGCQICWIPHYAERSLTPQTIIDSAQMATGYKVPK